MSLVWSVADDASVIHRLIEASDKGAAERSGTTAPARRMESTRGLVSKGFVHLGVLDGRPAVTVTVGDVPPFDPDETGMPPAAAPRYMQRLAVEPDVPDKLLGFHAVRHAIAVATAAGADVLRSEANPDLEDVLRMLTALGFERFRTNEEGPARRTYMQRALT